MPIKTILVPTFDSQDAADVFGAALGLGTMLGSHVRILHLRADPSESLSDFVGEAVSPQLVEEVIEAAETRAKTVAGKTRKAFETATKAAKAEMSDKAPAKGKVTASYEETTGQGSWQVEQHGRLADLLVVRRARNDRDVGPRIIIESALMGTGRPILVVPPKPPAKIGTNVAVAWNGSLEAARAVAAGMPFLTRAKQVTVITAKDGTEVDQKAVIDYLARQGVKAKGVTVSSGADTGRAICNAAGRAGADLLVMGGYTHSRVREMILGGVTEHVLSAARLPVLLAH